MTTSGAFYKGEPLVEGWLTMKEDNGSWFTLWRRRYVVLDQENQELRFYKKMQPSEFGNVCMDECGCIPLCLINEVQCRYERWSKGLGFHIEHCTYGDRVNFPSAYMAGDTHGLSLKRKKLIFRAPTSRERQEWVRTITHLMEMLRQARRGTEELLQAATDKVEGLERAINEKIKLKPPFQQSATLALTNLDNMAVIDLKSMVNPHKYVLNVLKAVGLLLAGVGDPDKGFLPTGLLSTQLTWSRVRDMLHHGPLFLTELKDFHLQLEDYKVPDSNLLQVRQLASFPSFTPSSVAPFSLPASSLCEWVICMLSYFDLLHDIQDIRECLTAARRQLEETARDVNVSKSEEGQRLVNMMPGGSERRKIEVSEHSRLGFLTAPEETRKRITSISLPYGAVTSLTQPSNITQLQKQNSVNTGDTSFETEEYDVTIPREDSVVVGSPVRGRRGNINIDVEEETTSPVKGATPNRDRLMGMDTTVLTPTQVLRCYSTSHRAEGSPMSPKEKRVERASRLMNALRGVQVESPSKERQYMLTPEKRKRDAKPPTGLAPPTPPPPSVNKSNMISPASVDKAYKSLSSPSQSDYVKFKEVETQENVSPQVNERKSRFNFSPLPLDNLIDNSFTSPLSPTA